MKKHYINQIMSYSMVGSLGFTIVASLQGCGDSSDQPPQAPNTSNTSIANAAEQGFFMVITQTGTNPDTYELSEQYPSSTGSRAVLKKLDGTEQILSEDELRALAETEAQRVEEGSSQLAQPTAQNQGLSLGETILAAAAGALIGGMIANRLMNNQNFRQHQQAQTQRAQRTMSSTRNPSASGNTANQNRTQPRSGFFGGGQSGNQSGTSSRGSNTVGG